jgi:glutaminase
VEARFSIQSISKVFTLASVMETAGAKAVLEKLGVDATGQVFNSIVAIEQMKGREMNPFVNPGAIATTSLVEGATAEEKWARILAIHEAFAGRKLGIDEEVYRSEAATNERNQAIAKLMHAYGRLYFEPIASTDVYTRQCSISVNASDLAVMAATLANGGRNPVTGKQVISSGNVARILAVMATAGLYDDSGIWLYEVGLPAKSGVGGGIIAVAPGRFGIAVFSPPLDAAGNSVRAQKAIRDISAALRANPYDVKAGKP